MTCAPNCPTCSGAGFIRREVPIGHADFGKLFPCPEIEATKLYDFERRGIYPEDRVTWDDLKAVPGVQRMKAAADELVSRGYGWAFFWGGPGQAKSVALKIIVRQLLEAKFDATYTSMSKILENLRAVYGEYVDKRETAETRMERWQNAPFLAIDEFEKARDTEFTAEKRFALIDARYSMNIERKLGMTVFASNRDPQEIDAYLASRIFDGRCLVVKLDGVDMRPAMEWK
jgi:DNA replication protein DnaC